MFYLYDFVNSKMYQKQRLFNPLLYYKIINKKASFLSYLNSLTATPIIARTIPIIHARIVTLYAGQPKASK